MASKKSDPKGPIDPQPHTEPKSSDPAASVMPATGSIPTGAQSERHQATVHYVDHSDLPETFADSVTGVYFEGQSQTLRIEFAVTRIDDMKPNEPVTGHRYPISRIVLPPNAAVDLINRLQQIGVALTRAGVVKATPQPSEPPKAG